MDDVPETQHDSKPTSTSFPPSSANHHPLPRTVLDYSDLIITTPSRFMAFYIDSFVPVPSLSLISFVLFLLPPPPPPPPSLTSAPHPASPSNLQSARMSSSSRRSYVPSSSQVLGSWRGMRDEGGLGSLKRHEADRSLFTFHSWASSLVIGLTERAALNPDYAKAILKSYASGKLARGKGILEVSSTHWTWPWNEKLTTVFDSRPAGWIQA